MGFENVLLFFFIKSEQQYLPSLFYRVALLFYYSKVTIETLYISGHDNIAITFG